MHVALVELFRCPVAHRDSCLVATADRTEARVILDGMLGCPVCGAEYAIRDGVTYFSGQGISPPAPAENYDAEAAMRIAALLNATGASATIALVGSPLLLARAVQSIVLTRCVVINAPDAFAAAETLQTHDMPMAIVRSDSALPLVPDAFTGIYVPWDEPDAYMRALRAKGRLIARVDRAVPSDILELARDATHWVGERNAKPQAPPPVLTQLRRRR